MRMTWVEISGAGQIAQIPRPRAGQGLKEDLHFLKEQGVDVLVSCLTDEDVQRFSLQDEAALAEAEGMEFRRFPIVDHSLPASVPDTVALADELALALSQNKGVAVHCYAGIGRSGLVLITTLVRCGYALSDAVMAASAARGLRVPETRAQREWLEQIPARSD